MTFEQTRHQLIDALHRRHECGDESAFGYEPAPQSSRPTQDDIDEFPDLRKNPILQAVHVLAFEHVRHSPIDALHWRHELAICQSKKNPSLHAASATTSELESGDRIAFSRQIVATLLGEELGTSTLSRVQFALVLEKTLHSCELLLQEQQMLLPSET